MHSIINRTSSHIALLASEGLACPNKVVKVVDNMSSHVAVADVAIARSVENWTRRKRRPGDEARKPCRAQWLQNWVRK